MPSKLDAIRAHCLAKRGAIEDYPWGDTVWKVGGKLFAAGSETHVSVRSTLEKQAVLVMHPHVEIAAYVGRYGWVTVNLVDDDTLNLALELIDESYDLVVAGLPKGKRPTEPGRD